MRDYKDGSIKTMNYEIEIGNIRAYQTYCPDKSRKFNERKLDEITTLKKCWALCDFKLQV